MKHNMQFTARLVHLTDGRIPQRAVEKLCDQSLASWAFNVEVEKIDGMARFSDLDGIEFVNCLKTIRQITGLGAKELTRIASLIGYAYEEWQDGQAAQLLVDDLRTGRVEAAGGRFYQVA